jgi:F0F1-type ATP synthase assembly protein I
MDKKNEQLGEVLIGKNHLQITFRVLLITVLTIGILTGLGFWLDTIFDTKPLGMVIGLVIGFPVTQVVIYKKFKNFPDNLK